MRHKPSGTSPINGHLLRLSILALCGVLAACQRPTQMLPPAPIFDMGAPQPPQPERSQAVLRPSLRDDATTADFDRFAQISRIYFERNSATLTDEARKTLDAQAEWLREHPDVCASLQGHADAFGTREHQLALGERRATAMKFHLAARGIGAERLTIISFGKQRPAAVGLDEASQKSNRRGETVLIGAPGVSGH